MGRVMEVSGSPQPFKNIPIKPAAQPQQPGEVLIGYELEVAGGCQLSFLGWCCFAALACTALPLSWLPFFCDECKKKRQRPIYGYPMQSISFIAPAVHPEPAKPASEGVAVAPAILCMDSTLEQAVPQHDQQQPQYPPQPRAVLACSPSPPPSSIFVPPSAVPSCGFTADNPFPSRYSPLPVASPKTVAALSIQSPRRAHSPAGTGLVVMGGHSLGAGN